MKNIKLFEEFINYKKINESSTLRDVQTNWEKLGSRYEFLPFKDSKARALSKPEFQTFDPTDIEVEQWFNNMSYNWDASAHKKILKGLQKYKGDYKKAGDRWEEYMGWIKDAMLGQGSMV